MATPSDSTYAEQAPTTYHTVQDAAYLLPNDASEHARLEEQAGHLSALMGPQIIHAPLEPSTAGLRVLDVGCGTGFVTDYLGKRFAGAEVFGLDLTPTPPLRARPANVRFLQGNVLTQEPASWTAPDGSRPLAAAGDEARFDLVFSRLLVCGLTDWPGYVRSAFGMLKPGGYMEVHDVDDVWYGRDGTVLSDSWPWWQKFKIGAEKQKLDMECASKAQQWMKEAGFVDISVREYKAPWGGKWEQTPELQGIGNYFATVMPPVYWHMIPKMMEGTGASSEDIQSMREGMLKEFQPEEGKHWKFFATTGRKPE